MNLPVRKCYYAGKLAILIIIVVTLLSGFERWRGGRRSARAQFLDPMEEEYEREILEDEARIIPGLGEGGVAAHLVGEAKRLGEQSEKELAINVYLSDRIAYNRTLKDQRNPACARVVYDAQLPSASVVVIFHNEPLSVLLRTVWSVLTSARRDRPWYRRARKNTGTLGYAGQDPGSPFVYLKEIILVDDNSTLAELRGKLSHYIRTRLPPGLVRLVRLPDRVGLTQARLAGARFAAGDVLVFLDAHCEAQEDWLRPLLQRVKEAPHAIAVPIIDVIEASNFYYSVQEPASFQGLMRARTRGARLARGDVLVFLDAHCEAGADWLRPLLQRLRWQPTAVVTPLIDVIDQSTFRLDAAEQFQVGGFTFNGHFTWVDVPEREKKRRGSDISPTWSPTMAGGLFAIRRAYFWELGGYDEQMAGWGGENLEMSFRVWQCGGTLETIPCSRVGHVFRSFHPYGLPAHTDTHGINTARMAEVWMDDYAELFYLNRPDLRNSPKIGDVTHRKVLREKLKCKSFQWFLDTVYPEKFVPVRDVEGYGRFRNPASGLCLDTLQRDAEASPLGLYPCHAALQPTQHLALSAAGELRDEERCAELPFVRGKLEPGGGRPVLMMTCHGKQRGQKWRRLSDGRIQHAAAGLCLRAGAAGGDVLAARCEPTPAQRWEIDYTRENNFGVDDGVELTEQQARLQRLRGVRRVSRSLLSEPRRAHRKRRPHAAHAARAARGRRKDKFVLQLVRGAQHLEAELFCRHRRLLPNDSFVRDLVAVLNDRDIKVINNGRVFEKNKVTELAKHRELKVLEKLVLPSAPAAPTAPAAAPAPADQVNEWESQDKMSEPGPEPVQPVQAMQPVQPVQVVDPVQPARAGQAGRGAARASPPAPPPPAERKIIVEDFVEVKPKLEATGAPKRAHRKRKRGRARGAGRGAARGAGRGAAPPLVMQQLPSAEDAPLLSAELRKRADDSPPEESTHEKRARARTSYPHDTARVYAEIEADARAGGQGDARGEARGEGHALAHSSRKEGDGRGDAGEDTREHSQGESREEARDGRGDRQGEGQDGSAEAQAQAGARARARPAPPVKLVMRSNLTFNLGDEFFDWKRAADDVAGLLGELAIPAASAEALRGASAAGEAPEAREARGETVLTGRGLPTSDGSSKEASGSSASASAEQAARR